MASVFSLGVEERVGRERETSSQRKRAVEWWIEFLGGMHAGSCRSYLFLPLGMCVSGGGSCIYGFTPALRVSAT